MFGVAFLVDVVFQFVESVIDKDVVNEGSHDFPVVFGSVEIGYLGWPINHGATGRVGAFPLLNIIPVLNGQFILEAKDFEADPRSVKVVLSVGKYIVAIREDAHDIDAGGAFGEAFEQCRQALSSFVSLGIMLDVLVRIDDGDRCLITSFDTFE